MALSLREKLTMLTPPSLFYRRRMSEETESGEPELALLQNLVPRGGTAIDAGANQGIFAYALSAIAERVVAFEPNPDYAFYARWMLRGRAEVHELALSDRPALLLELLSGTHENPGAYAAAICDDFGYDAFIVQHGEKIAALPAIAALGKNTSWGSPIES